MNHMGQPRKEEITITETEESLLSAVSHCSGNDSERDLATSLSSECEARNAASWLVWRQNHSQVLSLTFYCTPALPTARETSRNQLTLPVSMSVKKTGIQCRKLTPREKHLPQAPHSTRVEDGSLLIKTECFAFKMISGSQCLLEQKAYFMRI